MSANWLYQQPQPRELSLVENYVVFDTETTGLSAKEERLIEVSAVRVTAGQVVEKFSQLLNPGRHIGDFICDLTGINDELVAEAPGEEQVIPAFLEFIGSAVLIGHNVSFDINFINAACDRLQLARLGNQFIDTLQISRLLLPGLPHYKLESLVEYFGLNNQSAHRAWGDCLATQLVFARLVEYQQQNKIILKKRKAVKN